MDYQRKTRKMYIITIIIFIIITALGTLVHLWRGDDYKYLLLLFILINLALGLDEIYHELTTSKMRSSDMYLIDTRMQSILESLETLSRNVEKLSADQAGADSASVAEKPPEHY